MEKENEDFPRMIGARSTIQILEFLSDRDQTQYSRIQEFMNTHTLDIRLSDLLSHDLLQQHLQRSGREKEWYEITEKERNTLIYHLEGTDNIGESHVYVEFFKALQRSDILLFRIYTRNTLES